MRFTGAGVEWKGLAVAAGFLALCAGCAGSTRVVILDPMTFQAVRTEDGLRVDTLDPVVLFEEATTAWREGRFRDAAERFEGFLAHFGTHHHAFFARFNAGLAREALAHWAAAKAHFEAYLLEATTRKDRIDGLFRLGACQEALEEWSAMGETFDTLLAHRLPPPPHARAWVARGVAHHREGDRATAEEAFERVLDIYRENLHLHRFGPEIRVVLAQYMIGEIYRELFEEVPLKMPLERMRRDLEDKAELLLKAQHAYLKAIRLRDTEWSIAAGFRIGQIYEGFYADLIKAEVPAELDEPDVELYFDELRDQIRPVLKRAISVYERNLRMSERTGTRKGEWATRTRAHLERLEALLRTEEERVRRKREMEKEALPPAS